jgi:nitrite reductase/ring-hydroxylating ferredoxin subunit
MWIALISRSEVGDGQMREVEAGGRRVVVAMQDGMAYAFNAFCPHASARLVEGDLRSTYVICPLHHYRYALSTGRCLKPTDGPWLRVYPVEWRGDVLWAKFG